MRFLRRALVSVGVGGTVALILRVRGSGGIPPRTGSWRELSGPGLR